MEQIGVEITNGNFHTRISKITTNLARAQGSGSLHFSRKISEINNTQDSKDKSKDITTFSESSITEVSPKMSPKRTDGQTTPKRMILVQETP